VSLKNSRHSILLKFEIDIFEFIVNQFKKMFIFSLVHSLYSFKMGILEIIQLKADCLSMLPEDM